MNQTPRTYRLTLRPDIRKTETITTSSSFMDSTFTAPLRSPAAGGGNVLNRGDEVEVRVKIKGPKREVGQYSVRSMKILSSPAPGTIEDRPPGETTIPQQFFTTAFRRSNDFPDNFIMSSGATRFERQTDRVHVMRFPEKIPFLRGGTFSMIYCLTLVNEQDGTIRNFIDDPEIEVTGGYP